MSRNEIKNMAHSVNVRLKTIAVQERVTFEYILLRYAVERLREWRYTYQNPIFRGFFFEKSRNECVNTVLTHEKTGYQQSEANTFEIGSTLQKNRIPDRATRLTARHRR